MLHGSPPPVSYAFRAGPWIGFAPDSRGRVLDGCSACCSTGRVLLTLTDEGIVGWAGQSGHNGLH